MLTQEYKKGDWVRATHPNGAVVEGQLTQDMPTIGTAVMELILDKKEGVKVFINVNHWDVKLLRGNLLP